MLMLSYKDKNRKRLINLLSKVKFNKNPQGWQHVASVGGLLNVDFSILARIRSYFMSRL